MIFCEEEIILLQSILKQTLLLLSLLEREFRLGNKRLSEYVLCNVGTNAPSPAENRRLEAKQNETASLYRSITGAKMWICFKASPKNIFLVWRREFSPLCTLLLDTDNLPRRYSTLKDFIWDSLTWTRCKQQCGNAPNNRSYLMLCRLWCPGGNWCSMNRAPLAV